MISVKKAANFVWVLSQNMAWFNCHFTPSTWSHTMEWLVIHLFNSQHDLTCKTKFWSILPVVSSCAEPISTYSMHWNRDSCTAITFSTKVDQLIDAIITLWNYIIPPKSSQRVHDCCFPPGVCLHVLEGHIGIVRCLYLQGSRLISGGDRKRVVVWNVKVREILFLQPYIQQSFIHCCTSQWVFLHDNGYIGII